MLPGAFGGGDVVQLTTYAIVNGVEREVLSFSSDRELAGDLPDQVVSGGGVSGASGTIVWASGEDVQAVEPSPWHKVAGWPPSAGDRVQVYVTDGVTSFPRFSGVIDKTSGTVGGGMQSTVIDDRDRLSGMFTHQALLRHHVPFVEGGDYRSIGLSFWYVLADALRNVGIYNTPPANASTAVSVPLQGSVWPEVGAVTSAGGRDGTIHANFFSSSWGYSAGEFTATYQPRTAYAASEPLQVSMMVDPAHSGIFYTDVNFDTGQRVRFRASPDRALIAYWDGGSGFASVLSMGSALMDGATTATLLIKNGVWTIRNDQGRESSVASAVTGGPMSNVSLTAAAGTRVAGLQVSSPDTSAREFLPLSFVPSMRFTSGNLGGTMDMMPRIENRNVADLVDEICKATLTAAWWDESGVLNFVQSDRLRNGTPVQTITTLDDITELGWEDSLLSVRSKVEVTWKSPSISKGRFQRKELFRAGGDSLVSGDNVEVIAVPDGDTEWLGVDRTVVVLNTNNWGSYNSRRGSFAGYFFSANGETTSETGLTMAVTYENLGTAGVKVSHVAGAYPADVEAGLATSPTSIALWAHLRNQDLPVIRGFGEGKWVDAVYVSPTSGPSYAPALTHDLGYWGQEYFNGGSVARNLGDFIAVHVTAPTPTVTGVGVIYDPRRQLGDVVTIQSGILDVTIRALVVGISESHAPGDHSQDLTVRIISVTSTRKITYAEFEAAWAGRNYAAMETVWSGLTYADFENDPLEGAPNQ